ncbi:hypothetical protein ACJX0J_009315, partial [Zea mays]
GLMLIKALKLQQDMEDAENEAIMSELQSEENEEAGKTHEQDEIKIKEQDEAINELHADPEKEKNKLMPRAKKMDVGGVLAWWSYMNIWDKGGPQIATSEVEAYTKK